jgi:predicted nucleic acid-binding protein
VILVDTSVWVDHLRSGNDELAGLLEAGLVLGHAWVIGELALGHLVRRQEIIALLSSLEPATIASTAEVMTLIAQHSLHGRGIGYVDAQLLAATRLTPDAALWTTDKRLAATAIELGCAAHLSAPDSI